MNKVLIVTLAGMLAATAFASPVPQANGPETALVNINTATVAQLEALPGVGPSIAKRIVEYRDRNGRFEHVEDLLLVRGIGEKKFLQMKSRVTVGE